MNVSVIRARSPTQLRDICRIDAFISADQSTYFKCAPPGALVSHPRGQARSDREKETFAEETARITRGASAWHDAPEVRIERVQVDGYLLVLRPDGLASLAVPWPEARRPGSMTTKTSSS
ncbi:hypothetical protein [Sorangium cellulosum]|uniref:hypothetical protein n=1 Tax=Sorangium cellulosum TaxID=56 RepID=UPI0013E9E1BD|nr:hypothetical protein [Sorangium cellulosum]